MGAARRGQEQPRRRDRRQHRLALGPEARQLRGRDRSGSASQLIYAEVQPRGVPRPWGLCAAAFLLVALLVGLGVGSIAIGPLGIVESALSHVPFLHVHSPLSSVEDAIVWQL